MKKIIKIIIAVVVTVVIVFAVVDFFMKKKVKQQHVDLERNVVYSNNVQVYDAIVDNIILDEKSGIEIDKDFKNKIKSEVEEIAKYYSKDWQNGLYEDFRFYDLCKKLDIKQDVITIDYLLSFRTDDKEGFYHDNTERKKKISREKEINNSLDVKDYLCKYVDENKYDIISNCIKWYNEYIDKADLSNEDNEYTEIIIMTEYMLQKTGNLDKIDIKKMKDYLISRINNVEFDDSNKNTKISTIDYLCDANEELKALGEKEIIMDINKMYVSLDSEEDFEIDPKNNDEVPLYFMNDGLARVKDLSINDFYCNNINQWLKDLYKNNIEIIK